MSSRSIYWNVANQGNSMTEEQFIQVDENGDGQRLDRWMQKAVPGMPFTLIQRLLRKRAIRVDGKRITKGDTRLCTGQEVRIPALEEDLNAPKPERKLRDSDIRFIRSLVIYEDDDVIALNKPAGLAAQGGSKITRHVDGLLAGLADKKGNKPKLVHRLDKDTSGVLLLAKNDKTARELGFLFKGRAVRKYYWSIVSPAPEMNNGTIRAALRKAGGVNKERMIVDEQEGKQATTEFNVIERAHTKAAFVAFWPRTGRTHQIRVHAAEILGTPILGDFKYGFDSENWEDIDLESQLHLHARRVILPHPVRKSKTLDIEAPLPEIVRQNYMTLGFDPNYKDDPFEGIE